MLAITMVGLVVLFVPCYLGIRLGAGFATLFGIISMVPLTLLIILPVFKPSTFHWSNVAGFHFADPKTSGVAFFLSWLFVISWNGIGVEAAACYVAECRDPHRDAKLALTAEGLYGLFIYAATAIVFVAVLGACPDHLRPADPVHELRRPHLRLCALGQVPDRHPAHRRPAAVGAQRHHGRGQVAVPGVGGPADS